MFVDHLNNGVVLSLADFDDNVENMVRLSKLYIYFTMAEIFTQLSFIRLFSMGNDFEAGSFVTGNNADGRSSLNALASFRVRDDNAFDIFYDIAAGGNGDFIRQAAQHGPGFGRAVGNGNWFGAAHCRHQLAAEYFHITFVDGVSLFHICISISYL